MTLGRPVPKVAMGFAVLLDLLLAGATILAFAASRDPAVAPVLLVATLGWGGLIVSWFAFTVRLQVDERGLRGRLGLFHVQVSWADVARLDPDLVRSRAGLWLTDGRRVVLRLPHPRGVEDLLEVYLGVQGGLGHSTDSGRSWAPVGVDARAAAPEPTGTEAWRLPDGVEVCWAYERSPTELIRVNVLLRGTEIEPVATAARLAALRAADENRWDPSFQGNIEVRISALAAPPAGKLGPRLDAAIAQAREEIARRRWTTPGGRPLVVRWEMLG